MTELITLADPMSPQAEAFRSLQTSLAFAAPSDSEQPHSILIAAPSPAEDRSTPLANLAVVAAQAGRSVVVIDCDLRRPMQHKLFGLPNDDGLTTYLASGDGTPHPPLSGTSVKGLQVLTSGPIPPNPGQLLGANRMEKLIAGLRERADLILLDAPPVLAANDAAVLARQVDAVVMVLEAGRSRRDDARRARELLEQVGATMAGVVLTQADPQSSAYGRYG